MPRTVMLQGVRIALVAFDEVEGAMVRAFDGNAGPQSVFIVNAHTLNLAATSPTYRSILNAADLVLNDGIGVSIAARLKGVRFNGNYCGTDLIPALLERWRVRGLRVFCFGARPGRAQAAARAIESQFPGIRVVGTCAGYGVEDDDVVNRVNASGAQLLLVALGNPLQEEWIATNRMRLRVGVCVGVGALLDYLAGEVPRAPLWMRRARLEWGYRLLQEPRRLFARYAVGNPRFIVRALLDAARDRFSATSGSV